MSKISDLYRKEAIKNHIQRGIERKKFNESMAPFKIILEETNMNNVSKNMLLKELSRKEKDENLFKLKVLAFAEVFIGEKDFKCYDLQYYLTILECNEYTSKAEIVADITKTCELVMMTRDYSRFSGEPLEKSPKIFTK